MTDEALRKLLAEVQAVLLDFDGPICQLFAGLSAAKATDQLRSSLIPMGLTLPAESHRDDDPLAVYRAAATANPTEGRRIAAVLESIEERAALTARPTPGASAFIGACLLRGVPVAVVTNNSAAAVRRYVELHGLSVSSVHGRDQDDPERMKPSPWMLYAALDHLGTPARQAVMIGDAVRDIQAAAAACVPAIGFANKPRKRERLAAAGAFAVVDDMTHLGALINAHP